MHAPAEYCRLLRYGTPSDWLIHYDDRIGTYGGVRFPLGLSTSNGQKLLYETASEVERYFSDIALKAWLATQALPGLAAVRRTAQARRYAVLVAEAVLYRAAYEWTPSPLCAWWTIHEWIKLAHGVDIP